ncbi:MAG TPA: anhydro-N-acetylmuramic acid kinase, partial [Pirellulaceae bacterium]|nr:anhydro-N-acetylmuramic acid kinase [Pirellulaceae bacterium]
MDQVDFQDPTAPRQLLHRYQGIWNQRLAVGLSLDKSFKQVDAALVLLKGYGKSLRHQWTEYRHAPIPATLSRQCQELLANQDVTVATLRQIQTDLGEVLALATQQVISLSGKAKSQLLVLGIADPGIWVREFDGRATYFSVVDPESVAAKTGLTVIDAFPAKDIAFGGRGDPIDALALWLMFADRNPRVSLFSQVVIWVNATCRMFFLPASDGLDDEFPKIDYCELQLGQDLKKALDSDEVNPILRQAIIRQENVDVARQDPSSLERWQVDLNDLVCSIRQQLIKWNVPLSQVASDADVSAATDAIRLEQTRGSATPVIRVFANAGLQELICGALHLSCHDVPDKSQAMERNDNALRIGPSTLHARSLAATIPAIMSVMCMDQIPSSIPALTGIEIPRPLGRITPGTPTNWRQVVISMADYQPPA